MLLDKIEEAKNEFLNSVKPKYIELYGPMEPDLLFIDEVLAKDINNTLDVKVVLVGERDHISFHCKKHIDHLVKSGKEQVKDIGYGLTEPYHIGEKTPEYIFYDVFCDFEIKAYMEQSWQPDWSQAPEWANWWCVEKSGDAFWFYEKPVKSLGDGWTLGGSNSVYLDAPTFDYKGDWKHSLRYRNKQHF